MQQYNDIVMDHFRNPRNMGEIKNPDGVGRVGNMRCGDVMYVYIRVGTRIKDQSNLAKATLGKKSKVKGSNIKDNDKLETEEYIKDIKFKTLGCAAAISASSMLTELAKGRSLKEAEEISRDDINDALGKLPTPKYHCSILSADGIKKAIEDYKSRRKIR